MAWFTDVPSDPPLPLRDRIIVWAIALAINFPLIFALGVVIWGVVTGRIYEP